MKNLLLCLTLLLTLFFWGCEDSIVDPPQNKGSKILYVLNGSAETLSKIDMDDYTIVANIIETGSIPNRIRIFKDRLYIVSSGDDNIKVIDLKNDTEILQIIGLDNGDNPWDITFNNNMAYVSNWVSNTVSVIDLSSAMVTKKIDVGLSPEGIMQINGKIYVTNTGYAGFGNPYKNSSISVIDVSTNKVINTVKLPVNPQDLALAPDGTLHIVCTGDYATSFGKIAIVDISGTAILTDSINIGGAPGDIAITKDDIGYCTAWGDGTNGFVYSYNTANKTVINDSSNPIKTAPNLSQLEYDAKEDVLWIPYMAAWAGDGFVQKFDVISNTVSWTSEVVGNGSSSVVFYESTE